MEFNSRRSNVYSVHGLCATSQPLASEIGLQILKLGGNAADAAVGIAAALNVTQPTSTGIGGDVFALYYDASEKRVKGLNASGRCVSGLSIEVLQEMGYSETNRPDSRSPLFITVPGAAAGWVDTIQQFGSGRLTLAQILGPAINLAEEGYPVSDICAYHWKRSEELLQNASPNGGEMLMPNGLAPEAGDIMKMPQLANTFRILAEQGKNGFYTGPIAQAIVDVVTQMGGIISLADLEAHYNLMDTPIKVNYRGLVDVYEIPPNGQGITALLALNILEGFDLPNMQHNSPEHLHLLIESLRLAFADARYYVADPEFYNVPTNGLLSKTYAAERRQLISPETAIPNIEHGFPPDASNTVYFCVVDGEGNACSYINSNYEGFGTGIIPRGCGFTLHNRGDNFSLDPTHPNSLEPFKRPYHTIIPGMALKGDELFCPFGVMGGYMQPPGHVQVISNMVDFGMTPQEALDASRVQIGGGLASGQILLEEGISEETRARLQAMGHANPVIQSGYDRIGFGMGQIIVRNSTTGVLQGASDSRSDGIAIGF